MKKKYIAPCVELIEIQSESIFATSVQVNGTTSQDGVTVAEKGGWNGGIDWDE